MTQKRVVKEKSKVKATEKSVEEPVVSDTAQKLSTEMDAMLDEIDSLLEENAEQFIAGYIQAGGE